jgi:hypothetical protein
MRGPPGRPRENHGSKGRGSSRFSEEDEPQPFDDDGEGLPLGPALVQHQQEHLLKSEASPVGEALREKAAHMAQGRQARGIEERHAQRLQAPLRDARGGEGRSRASLHEQRDTPAAAGLGQRIRLKPAPGAGATGDARRQSRAVPASAHELKPNALRAIVASKAGTRANAASPTRRRCRWTTGAR